MITYMCTTHSVITIPRLHRPIDADEEEEEEEDKFKSCIFLYEQLSIHINRCNPIAILCTLHRTYVLMKLVQSR